ncbi:MAG: cation:proton antiporter [Fimbriimonadaceae bacterium]
MTDVDLAVRFFLQLAVILATCRVVGWLGSKFLGQTQVVMEMVAGVMLGPSLFGMIAPNAQAWLFPMVVEGSKGKHPSMSILYVASQLGLVLYMFCVGMEFDVDLLKQRARGAVAVSLAGIALPFALGAVLSISMVQNGSFFTPNVGAAEGALYLGAAMCITAFPMLARIIYERGLSGTSMGTLALAAGASDDAFAWALLAVVLASMNHDMSIVQVALGGGTAFAITMITVGKHYFAKLESWTKREGKITPPIAVTTFLILSLAAYFTDMIGIYAVFGAFIAGIAMPRGNFSQEMQNRLEHTTGSLLLPLFFCYSGLNTNIGLLIDPQLAMFAVLAVVFAIVGKWGGCTLAARFTGETWQDANKIGVLMNARGLMELIILNIGLAQGVITKTLYTVMVIMAIVTTLMASPIFVWLSHRSELKPLAT